MLFIQKIIWQFSYRLCNFGEKIDVIWFNSTHSKWQTMPQHINPTNFSSPPKRVSLQMTHSNGFIFEFKELLISFGDYYSYPKFTNSFVNKLSLLDSNNSDRTIQNSNTCAISLIHSLTLCLAVSLWESMSVFTLYTVMIECVCMFVLKCHLSTNTKVSNVFCILANVV